MQSDWGEPLQAGNPTLGLDKPKTTVKIPAKKTRTGIHTGDQTSPQTLPNILARYIPARIGLAWKRISQQRTRHLDVDIFSLGANDWRPVGRQGVLYQAAR